MKPVPYKGILCTILLGLSLVLGARWLAAQAPQITYAYDELGQLIKVIDATGNMAEYVYDPVGNILEIRRSPAGGLAIFHSRPSVDRWGPWSPSRARDATLPRLGTRCCSTVWQRR